MEHYRSRQHLIGLTCQFHPVKRIKFTTFHQQKRFIIILNNYGMPHVSGTISQLLETSYNQCDMDHMSVDANITYEDTLSHHRQSTGMMACGIKRVLSQYEYTGDK
eukprot:1578127-Ditylum_brightwellii.AAC.1